MKECTVGIAVANVSHCDTTKNFEKVKQEVNKRQTGSNQKQNGGLYTIPKRWQHMWHTPQMAAFVHDQRKTKNG